MIVVEKDQRVLLRIRPSLRHTLEDCPGLDHELGLQPKRRSGQTKRIAEHVLVSPLKKTPRLQSGSSESITSSQASSNDVGGPSPSCRLQLDTDNADTISCADKPAKLASPRPAHRSHSQIQSRFIKSHLHEQVQHPGSRSNSKAMLCSRKQKKWPKDFFVSEIDEGFQAMEKMMTVRNGKTLEEAFSVAFPGIKFGKTSEWKYRKIWMEADSDLKNAFIDLGQSSKALFQHFLNVLDDPRQWPVSKNERGQSESHSSSTSCSSFAFLLPAVNSSTFTRIHAQVQTNAQGH